MLQERRLDGYDFVVLILDGRTFAENTMVTALGLMVHGDEVLLGFVQTGTENEITCADVLRSLVARGLRYADGLLAIIDGSKGLRTGDARPAVRLSRARKRGRLSPQSQQDVWRSRPTRKPGRPSTPCGRSSRSSTSPRCGSLEDGLNETLTLHRLGVSPTLRRTLMTTNMLEPIFSQGEQRTGKVDRWRSSSQKHHWLAPALLDIEPATAVRGYRALPQLREALRKQRTKEGTAARVA